MKILRLVPAVALVAYAMTLCASAQTQSPNVDNPSFRVTVISRTTPAVKYEHRSGSTNIDFKGTDLMPSASGEAKVDSHRGAVEIKAEFKGLDKPASFGNEYLTYVMWVISPEGRAVNVGEVLLGGNRSKLDVTTDLQTFALIVTAEPYYAVRRPSNVVVMENAVRGDTVGTIEVVDAKYELIDRGGYVPTGFTFDPIVLNAKLPLEFFEARNAMRIAKLAQADRFATTSYDNAAGEMKQADDMAIRKNVEKKELIATSRETVQTAEDAREISMKVLETNRVDRDRKEAEAREASANEAANQASQRAVSAEADAALSANRANDESQRRVSAEAQTADANRQRDQAEAGKDEAQAGQATAEQGRADAQAEADQNRGAAIASDQQLQAAIHDREALRAKLLQQFNLILETHDTARGLVVNLSDVLFDSGKFTLVPAAREKLAKVSGIVLAYPSLKLAIEGYTDSVGSDDYNQKLSEDRADSVRTYLTGQGVPQDMTSAAGFGKSEPIASNDTASGRTQNRRVQLVVSGEVIGTDIAIVKVPEAVLQPAQ